MRLLFIIMLGLIGGRPSAEAAPYTARQGQVDLLEMPADAPLQLQGEWLFFWNEALTPQQFLERLQAGDSGRLVEIGKSFSEMVGEKIPSDLGFGTYVLRLKSVDPDSMNDLWIAGGQIYSSAEAYFFAADGSGGEAPVFHVGTFGTTPESNHPRLVDSHASYLPVHGRQDHYLLIQVANFHMFWGGIWVPPYMGHEAAIWKDMRSTRRSTTFLIGALFFIAFYNIALFTLRRSDKASLILGLFSLVISSRTLSFRLLGSEFRDDFFGFELPYKMIYIGMILSPSVLILFFRQVYPKHVSRRFAWGVLLLGTPYYLLVMATKVKFYGNFLSPLTYLAMLLTAICAYFLWKGVRGKEVGSTISFIGGSLFGLSCLMDVLWTNGLTWLPSNSLSFGLLFFILAQSQIMGLRFAIAFRRANYLSASLRDEVEQQTRDMTCILDSIQQGLFTVDDDELRVGAVRSPYLNRILPHAAGAATLDQLLLEPMQMSNDRKSQIRSTIQSSLGSDLFNFEVNGKCLLSEASFKIAGQTRLLEMDWTPMVDEAEQVDKMLICVRDITEMKKLQEQTQKNREELQMIEELANIAEDRFRRFAARTRDFIQQNITLLRAHPKAFERAAVDQLFINMHTIKGTARTYLLTSIAALSHDIEQGYAALIKGQKTWEPAEMISELQDLDGLLQRYEALGRDKLHWSLGDKILKVPMPYLEACLSTADQLLLAERAINRRMDGGLVRLVQEFAAMVATPLQTVIDDALKGLDSLARDLDKEMPSVTCNPHDVFIRNAGDELLHEVLVHLLRNAIDHGLETARDRLAAGKPPRGLVQLRVHHDERTLVLEFQDDGRGLNLDRIRGKAIERGLITAHTSLSPAETAELIFHSGLSTKEQVSQVSGRGVGMDAVRSYLQRSGGDIRLQLDSVQGSQATFRFLLTIPAEYWCSGRSQDTATSHEAQGGDKAWRAS